MSWRRAGAVEPTTCIADVSSFKMEVLLRFPFLCARPEQETGWLS